MCPVLLYTFELVRIRIVVRIGMLVYLNGKVGFLRQIFDAMHGRLRGFRGNKMYFSAPETVGHSCSHPAQ